MSRNDAWSGSWCKGKLEEHEKVDSIELKNSNLLSVTHSEVGDINIATMSLKHIDDEDITELLNGAEVDFILNVSKEPYITQDALQKSEQEGFVIGGLGDAMRALRDGDMESYVNPEIHFILRGLKQHSRVSRVTRLDNRRFKVTRHGAQDVTILALNEYDLTAEAVRNAIDSFPDFDAIVKTNPNGRISSSSLSVAASSGIKIFKWGELLGTLNRDWQ